MPSQPIFVMTSCHVPGTGRRYPFNRRLGGPQSRSERFGKQKKSLAPRRNPTPGPSSPQPSYYNDWAIAAGKNKYKYNYVCACNMHFLILFSMLRHFLPYRGVKTRAFSLASHLHCTRTADRPLGCSTNTCFRVVNLAAKRMSLLKT